MVSVRVILGIEVHPWGSGTPFCYFCHVREDGNHCHEAVVERSGKSVFFEGVWVMGSVLATPVSREVRAADRGLQVSVGFDRQSLFSKVS